MSCPDCGAESIVLVVPESLREHAPNEAERVALCSRCLTAAEAIGNEPTGDPAELHHAIPSGEAGVAALLLVAALDSLALNRDSIEALVDVLEREGVDVFALLERLASAPDLDPAVDLRRRSHQLEQTL